MAQNELPRIRRSELSEVKKKPGIGMVYIVIGIICVLCGIPMITIIIGFFLIIGGLAFIGMGINNISGMQEGNCPYCKNHIAVRAKDSTYKCTHCKKISTKMDYFLEAIE